MNIAHLFDTPSSFEYDPIGFVGNTLGHTFLVGAIPSFFFPFLVPFFLLGYAIWEYLQWKWRKAEVWDCWHDWAFVTCGAIAPIQPLVLIPMFGFFMAGIYRRAKGLGN